MSELDDYPVVLLEVLEDAREATFTFECLERKARAREIRDCPALTHESGENLPPTAPRLVALVGDGGVATEIDRPRCRTRHDKRLKDRHVRLWRVREHLKKKPPVVFLVTPARRVRARNTRRESDGLRLSRLDFGAINGKAATHELNIVGARPLARPEIDGDIVVPDLHRLVVRIRIELVARSVGKFRRFLRKKLLICLIYPLRLGSCDERNGRRILEAVLEKLRRLCLCKLNRSASVEVRALVTRMTAICLALKRIPALSGPEHHVMRLDLLLRHLEKRILRGSVDVEKRNILRSRKLARRGKIGAERGRISANRHLAVTILTHTANVNDRRRKDRRRALLPDAVDEERHVLRVVFLVAVALGL